MPRLHRQKGFTLVELLVVIAIIGVLIAVLLPAVSKARESSWTVICASNMRQLSVASHTYRQDYNQYLPIAVMQSPIFPAVATPVPLVPMWFKAIDPYLGDAQMWDYTKRKRTTAPANGEIEVVGAGKASVYACPATRGRIRGTSADTSDCFGAYNVDYAINGSFTGFGKDLNAQRRFWYETPKRNAPNPSKAFHLTDGNAGAASAINTLVYGSAAFREETGLIYNASTQTDYRMKTVRHSNRTCNYLFGDGHAETGWDWTQIVYYSYGPDTTLRNNFWRGADQPADGVVYY